MLSIKHQINNYTLDIHNVENTDTIYRFYCINNNTIDEYELDLDLHDISKLHILFVEDIKLFDELITDKPTILNDEKKNITLIFSLMIGKKTQDIKILIPYKQLEGDSIINEHDKEIKLLRIKNNKQENEIKELMDIVKKQSKDINLLKLNILYMGSTNFKYISTEIYDNIDLSVIEDIIDVTNIIYEIFKNILLQYNLIYPRLANTSTYGCTYYLRFSPNYVKSSIYSEEILTVCRRFSSYLQPIILSGKKHISFIISKIVKEICEDIQSYKYNISYREIINIFIKANLDIHDTDPNSQTIFDIMKKENTHTSIIEAFKSFL